MRWRLAVAYQGSRFAGWQVQPGERTVQSALEAAAAAVVGHDVRVEGSGRTDAGVHAWGQVCALSTTTDRSAKAMRDGMNAHLDDDVKVLDALPCPADFDPRRGAKRKLYRYTWLDRRAPDPLVGDRCWHWRTALDVDAMDAAARTIVGTHDFTSFRAAGCAAAGPVRTLEHASVTRRDGLVTFDVVGTGFLRHMVRILAGTLHEVGLGERTPSGFSDALAACDRDAAGRTAPAQGLALVWVRYDDPVLDGWLGELRGVDVTPGA